MKTTKKELDKMLRVLQRTQRDCFIKGSEKSLQVQARHADYGFVISVTCINANKKKWFKPSDGEGYWSNLEMFSLTSYYSKDENDKIMNDILDYLDYGQH